MTKMLRWSEENHDAWKQRQAAALAKEEAAKVALVPDPLTRKLQEIYRANDDALFRWKRFELVVPWPPTGNHAVKHTRAGRHYLTPQYVQYKADIAALVAAKQHETLRGRLTVVVRFLPPDNRGRDLDNVWKSLGDSLQAAGVFVSDAQIDDLHLTRGDVRRNDGIAQVRILEPL